VGNLTTKTVQGISWNLFATISNTVLQLVYTAVMARLLSPSDFGIMAMAMVVIKFGDYFSRMGMSQALVQKPDLNNNDIRSVFSSSVIMGMFMALLMVLLAPLFQYLFNTDEIVPLIRLLSLIFLLKGLSITSLGLLGKNLDFKKLSLIDILSFVVCNMGIGIHLAYNDFGVYSLIYAVLSQQLLMFIVSYTLVRHDIRPLFVWKVYKPLLSFGGRTSIISFLEYIGSSIDTFLIARFFGSVKLGLYNKARMLVYLPTYKLTASVSKVIFPAFSKIQNDKNKLGKAYLSAITLISALLFPICFGIFSASEEIVMVVLGNQWTDTIPLLAVLSFAIPFKLLSHFGGILCDATAHLNIKLVFQSLYLLFLSTIFYFFKDYGVIVFPVIVLIAEFLRNVSYMFIVEKITGINIKDIILAYIPGIIIGVIVGLAIYSVTVLLSPIKIPLFIKLTIQILTGGIFLLIFGLIYPHRKLKAIIQERFTNISSIHKVLFRLKWYRKAMTSN